MQHCYAGPSWRQICCCFWSVSYSHWFSQLCIPCPSSCWQPDSMLWDVASNERILSGTGATSGSTGHGLICGSWAATWLSTARCFRCWSAFQSFLPHPKESFAALGTFCLFPGCRTGSQFSSSFIIYFGVCLTCPGQYWERGKYLLQHCPHSSLFSPLLCTVRTQGLLAKSPLPAACPATAQEVTIF